MSEHGRLHEEPTGSGSASATSATSQMSSNMNYIMRDLHERLERMEKANEQLLSVVECLVEANADLRSKLSLFRGEAK